MFGQAAVRVTGLLGVLGTLACLGNSASAQITPDATLGTESSLATPNQLIQGIESRRIDGGAIRGANLFHSFQEFNIGAGGAAYFTNPAGINNILSRVTGSNPSNILGRLGVLGNANLFLINPNGIIFGENASLDVQGSFAATTANAIEFGNRGFFSATAQGIPPALTVEPSAFLFNQIAAQSIINRSVTGLQVPETRSLLLVGSNVRADGGLLKAPAGRIELGGLTESGSVGLTVNGNNLQLSYPAGVQLADVFLTNGAVVDTSGSGGGNIQVQGNRVTLTNESKIIADTLGSQNGGGIDISASRLTLQNGSAISASTFNSGNGGNLNVNTTESVELIGNGGIEVLQKLQENTFTPSDIRNGLFTLSFDTGAAGNLAITTPKLIVRDGAGAVASTFASGLGGSLHVRAQDSVSASSAVLFAGTLGNGNAGELTITTKRLILSDLATVETTTHGKGNAGNLTINAEELVEAIGSPLNPINPFIVTGIYADSTPTGENTDIGDAGNLTINTRQLILRDGSEIGAGTFGNGRGGNLIVNASESVAVTGALPEPFKYPSSMFAISTGAGNAGRLSITTRRLSLRDGGTIAAGTSGTGQGGSLVVNASDSVEIIGSSPTTELAIDAGFYFVESRFPSSLVASSNGTGNAGELTLATGNLIVSDRAQIVLSAMGVGNAGNLALIANNIKLDNNGDIIATTTSGAGGNMTIQASGLQLRHNSKISTTAGGSGNGGNINLNTNTLVTLENSNIAANAFFGRGGNVQINTDGIFVSPDSMITASSERGINGVVAVRTFGLDFKNALTPVTSNLISTEEAIAGSCLARRNVEQGRFYVTGTGGLAPTPYDALTSQYNLTEVKPIQPSAGAGARVPSMATTTPWKIGDPIVEARALVRTADGRILLTNLAPTSASAESSDLICHVQE